MASKKKLGCFVLLSLLFLLLVVFHGVAPQVITAQVNKRLPGLLNDTEASLGGLNYSLAAGLVNLRNLEIEQPEGFSGDPLLSLGSVTARVNLNSAMKKDPVVVPSIHVKNLSSVLILDTNGVINIQGLIPPTEEVAVDEVESAESSEETEESTEELAETEEAAEEAAPAPPVWVKKIELENIALDYSNELDGFKIRIEDLNFTVTDLQLTPIEGSEHTQIDGILSIPSERGTAKLRVLGTLGAIDPESTIPPPLRISVGLIGFNLDIADPFLAPSPAVAKNTLGGNGIDFQLNFRFDPSSDSDGSISGSYSMRTDRKQDYKGKLGGTLSAPELPFVKIFSNVLSNQVGRVFKVGGNIAQGGLQTVKGAADTAGAAVKGAGKTVGKFAGGALKTMKGVVTLNKEEAASGLKDATVGTVGEAAGTVVDTAGTAKDGVGDVAQTATGVDDQKKWWADIDTRVEEFESAANEWLEANPL